MGLEGVYAWSGGGCGAGCRLMLRETGYSSGRCSGEDKLGKWSRHGRRRAATAEVEGGL